MHFLENFLELVRFLNYSEEDQIHMSQFLIRTDADALKEKYCIAQVIATPSHVYIKHGLTWATCLRHTVTKCHMWPVTQCNATPTGHHRHGPGPTERCCPPGSGSHTTCVVCRGLYRNNPLMITAFSQYDNLNSWEGK